MLASHIFLFDQNWFVAKQARKPRADDDDEKDSATDVTSINTSGTSVSTTLASAVQQATNPLSLSEWIKNAALTVAVIAVVFAMANNANVDGASGGLLSRMAQITVDSSWGFVLLILALGVLMILERVFPDQQLPHVPGWWTWVLMINVFQLFAVVLATYTWEKWLQNTSYFTSVTGFHLRDHVSSAAGGLIAYLINTWLFYWWHYARHHVWILWILFHQFHHSPKRIETITSFYKHPLEIVLDSQLMAILLYSVLGLTHESSIVLSMFSGIGEYRYHMNMKTSALSGYFFQR